MKKVYFLCYSRYVIMIAYMIKKLYHQDDKCILLISDEIANENGIIEYISGTNLWDDVKMIPEKKRDYNKVYDTVDEFIKNNKIDVFYTSHIMRYASHYFVEKLCDETEINMFDEGIISLDIVGGYKEWCDKINKKGLVDYRFDRIKKYRVLFPQITKEFDQVEIEGIPLSGLLHKTNFIQELNLLFDYKSEIFQKKYLVIDADIAAQGDVSQEYENICAQKMLEILGVENSSIKIKPSESKRLINEKYNHPNISFIENGLVPFEVQYLNWIASGTYPKVVVSFPTTLIWNMMLLNQEYGISDVVFISIAQIMAENYFKRSTAQEMIKKIEKYKTNFTDTSQIHLPDNWENLQEHIVKCEDLY